MVSLPTEFRTSVETYSGPLDLLLYLIKKNEVDVFDIPVAEIVQQYHIYLEILKDIDPNACGDFLVMAANLMEIKSRLLLPREELDEEDDLEDPRIELVRQLLEYKKFKERALLLESRLQEHGKRYHRPAIDVPLDDDDASAAASVGEVDVWDLLTAFHRIQIALGQRVPIQVVVEERPVDEFMDEIVSVLESRDSRTAEFEELFQGARTRREAIGYFLAILELAKQYRLIVTQDRATDTIEVRLRSEEERLRMQREELEEPPEPTPEERLLESSPTPDEALGELDDESADQDADESSDDDALQNPSVDDELAEGLGDDEGLESATDEDGESDEPRDGESP